MTENFEDIKLLRKFENLATTTNRYYAYARTVAQMSIGEAVAYEAWVNEHDLTDLAPAHTLDMYFGLTDGES